MRMTTFKPKETLLFTALQSVLLTWGLEMIYGSSSVFGSIPLISFNPGSQKLYMRKFQFLISKTKRENVLQNIFIFFI